MKNEDKSLVEIECFEEGVGREENPNLPFDYNGSKFEEYDKWDRENPPLPAFHSDGVTPLPKEFKGGCQLIWQKRKNVNYKWILPTGADLLVCETFEEFEKEASFFGYETRQIYLSPTAPPVKEENPFANIDCHKCEQNSDSNRSCTCTKYEEWENKRTTPAQPFKAIDEGALKEAAEKHSEKWGYNGYWGFIEGAQWQSQQNAVGKMLVQDTEKLWHEVYFAIAYGLAGLKTNKSIVEEISLATDNVIKTLTKI